MWRRRELRYFLFTIMKHFREQGGHWSRHRVRERGEGVLLAVLLVFLIIVSLVILPMERYVGLLRVSRQLGETQMIAAATEEVQSQVSHYVERVLLERMGSHFQTALEQVPAFMNDLREGMDPLPTVEYRRTFFKRAFLVPHFNSWLKGQGQTIDPRLGTALEYIASLGGGAVIETRYIGLAPRPSAAVPGYIVECDVRCVKQEEDWHNPDQQTRLAKFSFLFVPVEPRSGEASAERVDLPSPTLYPLY